MTAKRIPQPSERQIERFWKYVDKSQECWEWQGATNKSRRNYGILRWGNTNYQAHRISYALHHGTDPYDKLVCHKCDNPRCVNPEHLFLGTALTNMQDRDRKGRHVPPVGAKNGMAKLDNTTVIAIRQRHAQGETQTAIGKSLGLNPKTINCVVRRETWKHI